MAACNSAFIRLTAREPRASGEYYAQDPRHAGRD